MQLLNIGFDNAVNADRVIAVVSPESSPVKRLVSQAKERSMLIDATHGRKTQSVIITDCDTLILSYLTPKNITARISEETHDE
jgi:regulator of extracellular matrix RemA (YlzA/DUF370 family)